jgi:hypothetical protein
VRGDNRKRSGHRQLNGRNPGPHARFNFDRQTIGNVAIRVTSWLGSTSGP